MNADLKVYHNGDFMGKVEFNTLMDNMTRTMESMSEYVDNAHAEIERLENVEIELNEIIDKKNVKIDELEDDISDLKDDILSLNDEISDLKDNI